MLPAGSDLLRAGPELQRSCPRDGSRTVCCHAAGCTGAGASGCRTTGARTHDRACACCSGSQGRSSGTESCGCGSQSRGFGLD